MQRQQLEMSPSFLLLICMLIVPQQQQAADHCSYTVYCHCFSALFAAGAGGGKVQDMNERGEEGMGV